MATYAELDQASGNTVFLTQVKVACIIAAEKIRNEREDIQGHANRWAWAQQAFANPSGVAGGIVWCILGQNQALTLAQITTATDAQIQNVVDKAINIMAGVR